MPLVACVLLGNLVFTTKGHMIAGVSRTVSSAEGIAQAFNFGFRCVSDVASVTADPGWPGPSRVGLVADRHP